MFITRTYFCYLGNGGLPEKGLRYVLLSEIHPELWVKWTIRNNNKIVLPMPAISAFKMSHFNVNVLYQFNLNLSFKSI